MNFVRKIIVTTLSHPAWTGLGAIIALIALGISMYQVSENDAESEEDRNGSETNVTEPKSIESVIDWGKPLP